MKRESFQRPGYDCMFAPCQHERKGDHGIHGEEWVFVSIANDRQTALVLTVYTDIFPETIPAAHRESRSSFGKHSRRSTKN
jgi:hypothetical protein